MCKKLSFFISLLLALSLVSETLAQTPRDLELWAEYLFDAPDPRADSSGNGYHISFLAECATVGKVQGYQGTAYHGDIGEKEYLPYAEIPSDAWPSGGNVTIEMMIYFDVLVEGEHDESNPDPYSTMMPLSVYRHYFHFESGHREDSTFYMASNHWWSGGEVDDIGYTAENLPFEAGRWYHWVISFDNTNKIMRHWIDSKLVAEEKHPKDADFDDVEHGKIICIGAQSAYFEDDPSVEPRTVFPFRGKFDNLRFYKGYTEIPPEPVIIQVSNPSPAKGKEHVRTDTDLCFQAPITAACMDSSANPSLCGPFQYDIYFGSDPDLMVPLALGYEPTECNKMMCFDPCEGKLLPGTKYYWRVDIKNASCDPRYCDECGDPHFYEGPIFSFTTWGYAINPKPETYYGADKVNPSIDVSWQSDGYADSFNVYFGDDYDKVAHNTVPDAVVLAGNEDEGYDPGPLQFDRTYYWRIDECNKTYGCIRGVVWSFTTAPFVLIDDFEGYNESDNKIYDDGNWEAYSSVNSKPVVSDD